MTSDLPIEIVTEILSWLPVKSLMRFKCVCKQSCFFIDQDSKFKAKHYDHASPLEFSYIYVWETNSKAANTIFDDNFIYYSNFGGLFLEKNRTRSQVFRVRNPAMHQALYLPDTHEGIRGIDFALNLFTGECKVACFYMKNVTYFGTEVGFEVITIGKDDRWRPLKLPKQNGKLEQGKRGKNVLRRRTFGPDKVEGGAHLVEVIWDGHQSYLEVQSFDVRSECFTVTTLPPGVFSDLTKVFSLRWNHFLAVADITDETLNVLVLKNFKEHKWSKKRIIVPLKFLREKPHLKGRIRPWAGEHYCEGKLHNGVEYITFFEPDNGYFFYDINTEEIEALAKQHYEGLSNTNYRKTSLITLKGMIRENV